MSDTVIQVENLGKKYIIGHQQAGAYQYTALRDVISDGAKALLQRLRHPGKPVNPEAREEFWALKDVSFEVKQGEVVGIIGRNGAGKSTLLKILSRITEPTTGRVRIKGRVASLLEVGTGFHPELTGRENIFLNGAILGMGKAEINRKFDEIVEFAEISRFLDTPVKRYSSGMYVRLAFAVAAHLEPEILVVDEVLAVGDAGFQKKCLGKINKISTQEGRTILLVSHQMETIQNLCKEGIFLDKGLVIIKNDIRETVQKYLESTSVNTSSSLEHRKDRQGSGKIIFLKISFKNPKGSFVDHLLAGEDVIICLLYRKLIHGNLKKLSVSIGIDDSMGKRITYLSTDLTGNLIEKTDFQDQEIQEIQVKIKKLPLMPGKYGVTLFSTINGEIADWIQNASYFNVEAGDFYGTGKLPPSSQGSFLVEHSFRIV